VIAPSDLRAIAQLEDVADGDLEWMLTHTTEHVAQDGERLFLHGDPADVMIFLLRGGYEARVPDSEIVFVSHAPQITGYLPYSRMQTWTASAVAVGETWYGTFPKALLPELMYRLPELAQRLVTAMIERSREATRADVQREKLASLGQLSAGLAHELNNPAASAKRDAESLLDALERFARAEARLAHIALNEARAALGDLEARLLSHEPLRLSALERSDRETELSDWLEDRGVRDAFDLAPSVVERGATLDDFAPLEGLPGEALSTAVERLSARLELHALAGGIRASVGKISDLVRAIKSYSYMDSAGESDVDINAGLESTLTMLGHKLKHLTVNRHLEPNLPKVHGLGGQLNQVWTNLIDNAADALEGRGGVIEVASYVDPDGFVRVTVRDDGPGIPEDVQHRLFEPFFTTKAQGKGTGLGLSTARQIVRQHRGEIRLESRPGETCFTVRLPMASGS
jgi:signal transduction histidine kinase